MNNKRIAVLLATIMAVSMVAMGFVGTAAASPADDEDFEGFVAANEADADEEDANHVVTINTTDSNTPIDNGDLEDGEIEITYDEGDDDELDASDIDDATDITVDVIESDGSAIASDLSLDGGTAGTTSGEITIDFAGDLGDDLDALSGSEIEEGDLIRIAIEGDHINHNNDGDASFDVDVDVQDDSDDTLTEQSELPLELPGPVENTNGDTTSYYSVASAVADASTGETVEVDLDGFAHIDELDQLLTQEGALGDTVSGAVDPIEFDSETGIALEGEDTPTVISTADDGNGDKIVALGHDEQSIEDIEFVGEGFLDDTASVGIDVGDNNEVTLEDVEVATVEDTAIVGTVVGDLTLDGVTVDSESAGLSITTVDDGDVDVEGTVFENVGDNTAIGVDAVAAGGHFVNVTDSTEITGLEGSDAVGIDVDASDDDAVVNIEDVSEIGLDGDDATAIVTDADDAGAEININNTDVDGYAEADDVGIELNGGDDGGGDELDVFIGEDTDVTGANTSVDVNFDASTGNDDAILTIDDAEFTLEGDGEDVTAIDADEGLEDGTYVISIEGEGVEINGDADTTGIHANDGDIELSVDEAHEDASEINDVGTGIHVEQVDEITGDQITNTSFDGVADTALDIEDDNAGLTLGDITVEDSPDATAVDYEASQNLDVEESELGTEGGTGVDTGLSVTDVDELTVTQEANEIWLAEDAFAGIHVDDEVSGEIEIENVDIVGFDGDEADYGINIQDANSNVKFDNDVEEVESSFISGVETGVTTTDATGTTVLFDIEWTTFQNIDSLALEVDDPDGVDGDELEVENIDVSDSHDATGVDIDTSSASEGVKLLDSDIVDVADGAEIEINDGSSDINVSESTITAESADGVGLNIDSGGDAGDVIVFDNEFTGDSEATAIEINENDGDYDIHFNDLSGFEDGYALAGDELGSLSDNEADANWYGTEFGPNADEGSNVALADDPGDALIYEPFLTDSDELDTLDRSEVTQFGFGQEVDGNLQTFAVPTTSQNTIDDLVENDIDGVLYGWDEDEQTYTTDIDDRPALEAYVVSPTDGDDSTVMLAEFASEGDAESIAPDTANSIDRGVNFVPAASGADVSSQNEALLRFGVSTDSTAVDTVTYTDAATMSNFQPTETNGISIADSGDDPWGSESVSPFHGYEVSTDGSDVGATQTVEVDAGATLTEALSELDL